MELGPGLKSHCRLSCICLQPLFSYRTEYSGYWDELSDVGPSKSSRCCFSFQPAYHHNHV